MLTRIRELVADGLPTRAAVARGITESAGTVTSAAVIMVSVFSIFILGHGVEFKQLGVGLSTAVLIDALIIRALVLPAALTLLGRWTWWPSRPQPVPVRFPHGPAAGGGSAGSDHLEVAEGHSEPARRFAVAAPVDA